MKVIFTLEPRCGYSNFFIIINIENKEAPQSSNMESPNQRFRVRTQHPLLSIINGVLVDLPTPVNISYLWNFGSLLGGCLIIQVVTGIFLAMHYCSDVSLAFNSIAHILRDVNSGFTLKYMHANGASLFFVCVYVHIGRGLYYGSYMKKDV